MTSSCADTGGHGAPPPLIIQEQSSFAIGGTVVTKPGTFDPYKPTPDGETLHGDHGYVFYQIPVGARRFPMVFLHGAGQFSKTWETTPDGREGFQNIFLRRRFAVYLVDQPRRGYAGRSTVPATISATPDEQIWFDMFRIGIWPNYLPGVQFSRDPEALNQFFRSMTPNTGPFDAEVISDAVSALFTKIGPAILVTHSQDGGPGWLTAIKNPNVRGVIAYEPGSGFVFPEGEVPPPMPSLTLSHNWCLRHIRSWCTDGMAQPSVGSDANRNRRNRLDSAMGWRSPGDTGRRCRLDSAGCETLAWRDGHYGYDTYRNSGTTRWRNHPLDGKSQR